MRHAANGTTPPEALPPSMSEVSARNAAVAVPPRTGTMLAATQRQEIEIAYRRNERDRILTVISGVRTGHARTGDEQAQRRATAGPRTAAEHSSGCPTPEGRSENGSRSGRTDRSQRNDPQAPPDPARQDRLRQGSSFSPAGGADRLCPDRRTRRNVPERSQGKSLEAEAGPADHRNRGTLSRVPPAIHAQTGYLHDGDPGRERAAVARRTGSLHL